MKNMRKMFLRVRMISSALLGHSECNQRGNGNKKYSLTDEPAMSWEFAACLHRMNFLLRQNVPSDDKGTATKITF